jgi:hypothetical protein
VHPQQAHGVVQQAQSLLLARTGTSEPRPACIGHEAVFTVFPAEQHWQPAVGHISSLMHAGQTRVELLSCFIPSSRPNDGGGGKVSKPVWVTELP